MEARKRAMSKRKKLRTLGKSRSTESDDEEEEEEGKWIFVDIVLNTEISIHLSQNLSVMWVSIN